MKFLQSVEAIDLKVLISTSSFGKYNSSPLQKLKDTGFKIILNPYGRKLQPNEIVSLLDGVVGLIAGTGPITEKVLKSAKNLKVISRCGAGLDNVNLEVTRKLGIKVFTTPDAPTQAVAELALGLILSLLRKTAEADRNIRQEKWPRLMGNLLFEKKLGIIGLGRIGKKLVELTFPFKVKVLACELYPDKKFVSKYNIHLLSLKELLSQADIVSLHLPYSETTRHMIGKNELLLMKPDAILINTSRGGIVDEEALYNTLKNKIIGGAALDVFEEEPYKGPLKNLDNVVMTSHLGSYAKEARIRMEMEAVNNLLRGLKSE